MNITFLEKINCFNILVHVQTSKQTIFNFLIFGKSRFPAKKIFYSSTTEGVSFKDVERRLTCSTRRGWTTSAASSERASPRTPGRRAGAPWVGRKIRWCRRPSRWRRPSGRRRGASCRARASGKCRTTKLGPETDGGSVTRKKCLMSIKVAQKWFR